MELNDYVTCNVRNWERSTALCLQKQSRRSIEGAEENLEILVKITGLHPRLQPYTHNSAVLRLPEPPWPLQIGFYPRIITIVLSFSYYEGHIADTSSVLCLNGNEKALSLVEL
jgi:hypothetical protein